MNDYDGIGEAALLLGVLFYFGALVFTTSIGIGLGYLYLLLRGRLHNAGQRPFGKKIVPIITPGVLWVIGILLFYFLKLSNLTSRDEFIIMPFYSLVPFITAVVFVWSVNSSKTNKKY